MIEKKPVGMSALISPSGEIPSTEWTDISLSGENPSSREILLPPLSGDIPSTGRMDGCTVMDGSTVIIDISPSRENPSSGEILLPPPSEGYPIYVACGWIFCCRVILSLSPNGRVSTYKASGWMYRDG